MKEIWWTWSLQCAPQHLTEKLYPMLCHAMPCHAMLCYAMLCYAMLCYSMLCYAMLCCAILSYPILPYSFRAYGKCSASKPCVQREQFNCQAGGCHWETCALCAFTSQCAREDHISLGLQENAHKGMMGVARWWGSVGWEVNSCFPLEWLVCLEYKIPKRTQKLFWYQDPEVTDVYL